MTPDLRRSKAEGACVDISLVPIDQMQAFLLSNAQVPPSGKMAESERLPPACMPVAPTEEYQEHFVFCFSWHKEAGQTACLFVFVEIAGEKPRNTQPQFNSDPAILNIVPATLCSLYGQKTAKKKQKFWVTNSTMTNRIHTPSKALKNNKIKLFYFCKWDNKIFIVFSNNKFKSAEPKVCLLDEAKY